MRTITKEIEIDVYTPTEAWNDLAHWYNIDYLKDKVLIDGKINIKCIDEDVFDSGLKISTLKEYFDGLCSYYCEDYYYVFEQDNELYVLTYIE